MLIVFVNTFHENCYPKFPPRNEVRFGTTDYSYAETFAETFIDSDATVYQIFPSKKATVYYNEVDPSKIFTLIKDHLHSFIDYYDKWHKNNSNKRTEYPSDLLYLADSVKQSVQENNVRKRFIEIGCLEKIIEDMEKWNNKFYKSHNLDRTSWFMHLANFFGKIKEYFSKLQSGYPELSNEKDEVVFKGEYLQVDTSINYF